jgi:hypothetical protein
MLMVRRAATCPWAMWSALGMLTIRLMLSSMDRSCIPWGSMGMLTINSAPLVKGVLSSKGIPCGTRCWFGAKRLLGSQLLACRIAFARLQIGFKVAHHLYRHSFPPKLSQSIMRRMLILMRCVQVCTVVATLRWHCWKVDLKSIFDARIWTLGKR